MTGRTVHALDAAGYVRDWLTGPAWSTPCDDLGEVLDGNGDPSAPDGRWVLTNGPDVAPLKERLYARRPLVVEQELPCLVEGGDVSWVAPGALRTDSGVWQRARTGRDGLVDWSAFCATPEYRHAVAGTVLEVDQAEWRTFEVACTGPFALWAGDELLAVRTDVSYMELLRHEVAVRLHSGTTRLLLATWQVAFRECRHVAAVRVTGPPVRVVLPSPAADEYAAALAEQVLDRVAVRSWALPDGVAQLSGPTGAALAVSVSGGRPAAIVLDGGRAELPVTQVGETELTVRVDDPRCPVQRTLRVAGLPPGRRAEPIGDDPAGWRDEVLRHVADGAPGVARALARHALDGTAPAEADLVPALRMVWDRADCADFEALGLLHLLHRAGGAEQVGEALRGFKYWIDQPGLDAMCYFTENHQLVWHTAELLAGEAWPDAGFANTGWTGRRHAAHGREMALAWMRRKLAGGFSEFDSNAYVAIDALALVSLVELADDAEVRRVAEALLDLLLLTLASNSWRGIHGAAHGRSYTPTLRSSRFEETAPLMWALWGTGALNGAVLPATVLCLARRYRLPPMVRAVATLPPERWSGRQVYRGELRFTSDLLSRPYGSDLNVWRTPDAMLSSVQDYRPGLPGLQEHVWGATIGPEAQVFATAPAADTTSSSARPNAWAGQRVLPRVRQHRDTLLVVYPGSVRTHLWFPAPLMDEVHACGPWLAGRVGDGYVAVAAPGGLRPTVAGDEARQAWLPRGAAYVATVGRRTEDGSFESFVAGLRDPEFSGDDDPLVRWAARDGRVLELGWSGPFLVDGAAAGLAADGRPERPSFLDNPAVRTPHAADRLEASWAGHRLVLDLAHGRRLEPASDAEP